MRRALLATAVVTALVVTGCGSTAQVAGQAGSPSLVGDGLSGPATTDGGLAPGGTATSGPTTPTTTTNGSIPTTGTGPSAVPGGVLPTQGVTTTKPAGTGPVKIGIVTTSVGNAAALGINAGQSYTDKAMWTALVEEYNARGGLAGRKIVPVFGETDTASSNWESQFAAVCATFTQDNRVEAVIGYVFVFLPSFESCLAKAGIPHLYGGYQPGDKVAQQQYPGLIATGHPTVDGSTVAVLEGALRTGLLSKSTKLGLLLDTCAHGDRAYSRTVEPWLKAHAVNFETVIMNCAQGSSDVSSGANAVSSAGLRFAASGVNLVLANGIALLLFMINAQTQGYSPQYLTSLGGAALEQNAPGKQMKNLHGFGWMPSVDVNPGHQPYARTPGQAACVGKVVKRGLRPSQYNDFMALYQACDGLELYAKALAAGARGPVEVVNAVASALPSFRGTGTYSGLLRSVSGQRGGPGVMRAYAWTDRCSCFTYRGPTMPIPTP
jgi:hypothetical protein